MWYSVEGGGGSKEEGGDAPGGGEAQEGEGGFGLEIQKRA